MSKKTEVQFTLREIIFNLGCVVEVDRWDEEGKGYLRVVHVSELRENRHCCILYKERGIFHHLETLSIYLQDVGRRARSREIAQLLEV